MSQFRSRAQLTMWRCPLLASGAVEMAEAEKEGVSQTQRNKKRLRENSLAKAQTSCLLWPSWGTALTFIPCRNSTGLRFLLYNSQPTWTYNTCKYELALRWQKKILFFKISLHNSSIYVILKNTFTLKWFLVLDFKIIFPRLFVFQICNCFLEQRFCSSVLQLHRWSLSTGKWFLS